MFSAHNINSNNISIKNLILLFLTIVMGFASIITLAQISIPSSIENARQTIKRVTITSDGTDNGVTLRDFNDDMGRTYITGLVDQGTFSGRILGIDDNGYIVYTYSNNLVVSGSTGGGGRTGDAHWSGDNLADIRNLNAGKVGIGTSTMSGKLHVKSSGETNIYIEEISPTNAANLNLKTINNRWMVGAYDQRFYIGVNSTSFLNITTGGRVGIGTITPKANLQVIGNFIAGTISNYIIGNESSIGGGSSNTIIGHQSSLGGGVFNIITGNNSFIGGGYGNKIDSWNAAQSINIIVGGKDNIIEKGFYTFIGGGLGNKILGMNRQYSIIVGGSGNIIDGNKSFIGGGQSNTISGSSTSSTIVGGQNNEITSSDNAFIGGGGVNKVTSSNFAFIGGGQINTITGTSTHSVIPGGFNNRIEGSLYSFAAGVKTKIINYSNTFARNSDFNNDFIAGRQGSFLINVPMGDRVGGVGINTPNPQATLHVSGHILGHSITLLQDNTGISCLPGNKGQIILSGNNFFGCNGSIRKQLDN